MLKSGNTFCHNTDRKSLLFHQYFCNMIQCLEQQLFPLFVIDRLFMLLRPIIRKGGFYVSTTLFVRYLPDTAFRWI